MTINSDSGWSGIPDVRYEDSSALEGAGGEDDEDGISFFNLFIVSVISFLNLVPKSPFIFLYSRSFDM